MRIATWNIRAGGGKRIENIARVILEEEPDILVLTEYRSGPGAALLEHIQSLSYSVLSGVSIGSANCACILSRYSMVPLDFETIPGSSHRWVAASISALDLIVLGVHVPNQSEIWNKREFWNCIEAFSSSFVGMRSVIIGDLNTALDEDCEGDPIREAVYFKKLLDAGWVDAWRKHNPAAREFSWFSHRFNGFRIDHCLVSPFLTNSILGSSMRHDVRTDRISDHSMLRVELEL